MFWPSFNTKTGRTEYRFGIPDSVKKKYGNKTGPDRKMVNLFYPKATNPYRRKSKKD